MSAPSPESADAPPPALLVRPEDGIAVVRLHRPEATNALSLALQALLSRNGQFFNYDFYSSDVNDTALLSANYALRQSLFFNQTATVFGMDYTFLNNKNKQLLLNGFDSRDNFSHELRWRLNFKKSWSILSNNSTGIKYYASQFFSSRNYKIEY